MKRSYRFVRCLGTTVCTLETGEELLLPIFPGLLKHPTTSALPKLLRSPTVARKYTLEALLRAPWPVLRHFPRVWVRRCLDGAPVSPGRRRALEFLIGEQPPAPGTS